MRSSTGKYIAVLAVVIIIAAGVVIYLNPFGDKSSDESDARYYLNYKQESVDSITLSDGKIVTKADGPEGTDAIYVYTVAFKNDYTSSTSFYLFPYSATSPSNSNTVVMKTIITNPKSGEESSEASTDTLYIKDAGIREFYTTSYNVSVYAGTTVYFQVAFFHKDYSSRATDSSTISVELDVNKSEIANNLEKSKKLDVPDGPALQFKASPTLTTSAITTKSEITLSNGSTAKADDGYIYRIYKFGMRSMGEACTINPGDMNLIVEYKDRETSVTAGKTYAAVADYIESKPISLEAWSDDENTQCQTIEVAFMVPLKDSTVASSVTNTVYLLVNGHAAGVTTNNHVIVG